MMPAIASRVILDQAPVQPQSDELLIQLNERMHRSIRRLRENAVDSHSNVTSSQLSFMSAVLKLGHPSLSQVADEQGITRATASITSQKLILKGLLSVERSDIDKRFRYLELTEHGRVLLEAQRRAFVDFSSNIRRTLSDGEIRLLEEVLEKMVRMDQGS